MLTGELKNKVDSLWEIFWTGGLTNPLDVIEQMTYLMFIHDLDTTDNLRAKESAMLGLPYKSIFSDEVQIGDRKILRSGNNAVNVLPAVTCGFPFPVCCWRFAYGCCSALLR